MQVVALRRGRSSPSRRSLNLRQQQREQRELLSQLDKRQREIANPGGRVSKGRHDSLYPSSSVHERAGGAVKFVYLERPHDSGVLLNLEAVDYCEPNTDGNRVPAQRQQHLPRLVMQQ
jgi:hypothetical protein